MLREDGTYDDEPIIIEPSEERVRELRYFFNRFPDRFKLDAGIADLVVNLNTVGLTTWVSCEGWNPDHRNYRDDHPRSSLQYGPCSSPHIYFGHDVDGYDLPIEKTIREGIFVKIQALLEMFYTDRKTPPKENKLAANKNSDGVLPVVDIACGEKLTCDLDTYRLRRAEFDSFNAFIKARYLTL